MKRSDVERALSLGWVENESLFHLVVTETPVRLNKTNNKTGVVNPFWKKQVKKIRNHLVQVKDDEKAVKSQAGREGIDGSDFRSKGLPKHLAVDVYPFLKYVGSDESKKGTEYIFLIPVETNDPEQKEKLRLSRTTYTVDGEKVEEEALRPFFPPKSKSRANKELGVKKDIKIFHPKLDNILEIRVCGEIIVSDQIDSPEELEDAEVTEEVTV